MNSAFPAADCTMPRRERLAFRLARGLLGLTLFAAPLPYGAVYPWGWASIAILALLVLVLWTIGCIQAGRLRIGFSPIFGPAILFLLLGGIQLALHLTLAPAATRESLLNLAADLVLFFVAIQLFVSSPAETWRRVGLAVLVFGFVFSFLSILQFLWNPSRIIWFSQDVGSPFGPYVDRDHYAGLMEMITPVSAAYALSRPKRDPLRGILWFGVMVPMASVLLTGSRGGFAAVMLEMAALGWVVIWQSPRHGRRKRFAAIAAALVLVAALFFWLVPEFVLTKLGTVSNYAREAKVGRLTLWKDSLGIVRDHPLMGAGLGSFVTIFPMVQSSPQDLITEHAHNDYLEALAETGLAGALLVLAALVLFLRIAFRTLAARLKFEAGWIQLGAAIGCCGLLLHSLVDFNLHIPANAAWFVFCAALACLSG